MKRPLTLHVPCMYPASILLSCLLLLFATTPAHARTYSLIWQSDWPIAAETVAVTVVGGDMLGSTIADDGKSGQVDATSDRACLTIRWSAQTVAGFPVATITRGWYDDCERLYFPMVIYGQ